MVDIGNGESVPADVMIAVQLKEYGLHPKQLAWVLNVWSQAGRNCSFLASFLAFSLFYFHEKRRAHMTAVQFAQHMYH